MSNALDRLVGERVMGLTPWREDRAGTSYVVWTAGDVKPWSKFRGESHERESKRYTKITANDIDTRNDIDCGTERMRYSTSISAAWDVVEHLRKQRHNEGGRKYLVSMIDHTDSVEIVVEDFREGDRWYAVNESAPMAICLAALRAVGVPEATIQEACK